MRGRSRRDESGATTFAGALLIGQQPTFSRKNLANSKHPRRGLLASTESRPWLKRIGTAGVGPYGPSCGSESGLTGPLLMKPIVSELRWPQTRLSYHPGALPPHLQFTPTRT